jgi:NTP pyrophosphatase (non-canonical NTP hydrolase)
MGIEYLENLKKIQDMVADNAPYTFDQYNEDTRKTAVYPHTVPDDLAGIVYCTLGLAGEAGEVAGKVKKLLRDGDTPEKRKAIVKEIGDNLWYIPRLLEELGNYSMAQTALENVEKLHGRLERGTLHGDGDDR